MTARELYPLWWIPHIVLFGLVGAGFMARWRTHRYVALAFGMASLIAIIAACGTADTVFAPINRFITDIVPVFAGYREPQKFVAVLALAYAYFAAHGLGYLWQRAQGAQRGLQSHHVKAIAVVLPVLLSPLMLWGFHGQLAATQYPSDWYAINQRLQTVQGKVLFLPWHQYMRFGFAGRVIANPANHFFDAQMLTSSNPELQGLDTWPSTQTQQALEKTILPRAANGGHDMGAALHKEGIQYVLLANENDFMQYAYLDQQSDLRLVQSTDHLRLYEVRTTINGAK